MRNAVVRHRERPVMLFILIGLLLLSLLVAFRVRASWAYGLPGVLLIILLIWLLFA